MERRSVLFVCLGNICRSPMAEAVFTHIVKQRGLEEHFAIIDSCGTAGYHAGDSPDVRSADTCRANGVAVKHRARQLTVGDHLKFDYILCMDQLNLRDVLAKCPKAPAGKTAKVQLFGEFDAEGDRIIRDPYYDGQEAFDRNFRQCVRCSEGFLSHLGLI